MTNEHRPSREEIAAAGEAPVTAESLVGAEIIRKRPGLPVDQRSETKRGERSAMKYSHLGMIFPYAIPGELAELRPIAHYLTRAEPSFAYEGSSFALTVRPYPTLWLSAASRNRLVQWSRDSDGLIGFELFKRIVDARGEMTPPDDDGLDADSLVRAMRQEDIAISDANDIRRQAAAAGKSDEEIAAAGARLLARLGLDEERGLPVDRSSGDPGTTR